MPMERSILDKVVNGALLGKRKIGRPIRYNLRTKHGQGYVSALIAAIIISKITIQFIRILRNSRILTC